MADYSDLGFKPTKSSQSGTVENDHADLGFTPLKPEELGKQGFGDKVLSYAKEGLENPMMGLLAKPFKSAVGTGLKAVDSVTGAPTRSAIYAAQGADTPGQILPDAWKAGKAQFGDMEHEAPSGEQIVERAGVPHGVASKVAGFGMDIAANPLNLLGFSPLSKLAGSKVLEPASEAISSFANKRAFKAAGAGARDFKALDNASDVDRLGGYLLDTSQGSPKVGPLSTPSNISERLKNATPNSPEITPDDIAFLQRIAKHKAASISAGSDVSHSDKIALGIGLLSGHETPGRILTAIGLLGANKLGRAYGNPLMATGAKGLANTLEGTAGLLKSNSLTAPAAGAIPSIYTDPTNQKRDIKK